MAYLGQLQREGWIKVAPSRGWQILPRRSNRPVPARAPRPREVGLITPLPVQVLQPLILFWVEELRAQLAEAGYHLQMHTGHCLYTSRSFKPLENLIQKNPAVCWVLRGVPEKLQRWFSERRLPALVAGSCHPEVSLPSLDGDHRAACRHAAGMFLAKYTFS